MLITIACSSRCFMVARALHSALSEVGVDADLPTMADAFDKSSDAETWRPLVDSFLGRIDRSRVLYVLAPGGGVGVAVASQIGYAHAKGLSIVSSEPLSDGAVACMVSEVVPADRLVARFAAGDGAEVIRYHGHIWCYGCDARRRHDHVRRGGNMLTCKIRCATCGKEREGL